MRAKAVLLAVLVLTALALYGCVKTASVDSAAYYSDVIEVTPVPTPFPSQQKASDVSKNIPNTPEPSATQPEPTASPTDTYALGKLVAYVDANTVNLRTGPGTDTDTVTELEHFDRLYIVGRAGEWYKVSTDGKEGYILAEFLRLGIVPTPETASENKPQKTEKPAPTPKTTPKPTQKPTPTPELTSTPEPENTPKPVSPDSVSSAGSFSASDVLIIAQITYKESRRGDVDGYKAVANVILNRINSSRYPNTAEGVVFQGNGSQFSPAKNEAVLRAVKPSDECISAVEEVLAGNTILPAEVLSFRSASKGTTWGSKTYYASYGGNAFFS